MVTVKLLNQLHIDMVAGVDQVAVDAVGATLLGYKPDSIVYIVQGNARGLGTMDFKSLSPRQIEV